MRTSMRFNRTSGTGKLYILPAGGGRIERETRSLISAPDTATRGVVTVAEKWKSGVVGLNASFVRSQIDRRRSLRSCVV